MGLRANIAILDFGSQYSHLISRRVRELGVYAEIFTPDVSLDALKGRKGIILSGGPRSVYEEGSPQVDPKIFGLGIPILGVCYGHQLFAYNLGGKVLSGKTKEYGFTELALEDSKLFKGLQRKEVVWMSHGDYVDQAPPGFRITATSEGCPITGMSDESRDFYGIQFHPEVTHTKCGMTVLKNFIFDICKAEKDWSISGYIHTISKEIKEKVGDRKVFLLVSGGIDSTVCFALLNKVLGKERVYGLHIDNGFLRKHESKNIKGDLSKLGFDNLHVVDAEDVFLSALRDVYEPEQKRRIIGQKFIDVQRDSLEKLGLDPEDWVVAQGTIYPDTIESMGTKHADLIKTHHNRVAIIQEMIEQGSLIDPIAYLYKDEVRELGEELGLPKEAVWRHPFPGPGLSIRCLCSDGTEQAPSSLIFEEICRENGLSGSILPIRSVGVQGDCRTYRNPAAISGDVHWDSLERISTEITNRAHEVNRVVVTLKACDDISLKKAYLTKERLDLLREIDVIVNRIMKEEGLQDEIWQFPIVLIPLGDRNESVVLRPISSKEAMTARFFDLGDKVRRRIVKELSHLPIDCIYYDVTNKPPATIEWE